MIRLHLLFEHQSSRINPMLELSSKPQKSFNPVRLYIAIGVLAVFAVGVGWYIHYQSGRQTSAGKRVVVPNMLHPGDTNFEYYKTRVRIENVKATLGINLTKSRIALIGGTIINDGDRELEAVELHLTLYDVWGKVSKERTVYALRPGIGYGGKPMEPLERRSFAIGIEPVEDYWNPKQIEYEIIGLRYK